MADPGYEALERLGRVRLSRTFFMRDFLYSETSNHFRVPNIPDDVDSALWVGKRICEELLEPLQDTFGRIHIRSAFRSEMLNRFCVQQGLNCAPNEQARGGHIWDSPDARGKRGGMVCIVIPWLIDACESGLDWRQFAFWVHDHLAYSVMIFYRDLLALNISWNETPLRKIFSRINPEGTFVPIPVESGKIGEGAYTDLLLRLKGARR